MSKDPLLYQFLASAWPYGLMDRPEWEAAVREACTYREGWLGALIESAGIVAVTEVLEQIQLDWGTMRERLNAKSDAYV